MKLAVVIPTYNEKSNITTLFPKIFDVCNKNGINICLIVVDDNSPDGTAKAVKKLGNYDIELIERKGKLGIGTAYIAGFRRALELNADLIMSMDADWTHQPESIKILVGASDKFDVVIGSRYIPGGKSNITGYRLVMSKGANWFAGKLFGINAKDLTSGMRCYKAKVLRDCNFESIKTSGYSFLEEILFLCKRKGFSIGEVPIFADLRRGGESKLAKKEIFYFFINMLRLKMLSIIGKI